MKTPREPHAGRGSAAPSPPHFSYPYCRPIQPQAPSASHAAIPGRALGGLASGPSMVEDMQANEQEASWPVQPAVANPAAPPPSPGGRIAVLTWMLPLALQFAMIVSSTDNGAQPSHRHNGGPHSPIAQGFCGPPLRTAAQCAHMAAQPVAHPEIHKKRCAPAPHGTVMEFRSATPLPAFPLC